MDLVIITFVVTIVFFIIYKYDIFKSLATRGVIEKDFSQCYILSYPKRAEIYQIKDLDEFFELNPKLKGKIPVEKRQGIDSSNPDALKRELEERKRLKEKYSKKKKKK